MWFYFNPTFPTFSWKFVHQPTKEHKRKNSVLEPSNHTFLLHQEDIWKRMLLLSGKSQLSVWHIFHLHTLCREQWKVIQREEKGPLTKVQKSNKDNLRKEATVHNLKSGEPTSIYNCFRSVQACRRRRKCQIVTFGILEEANISEISANSSLTGMVCGWGETWVKKGVKKEGELQMSQDQKSEHNNSFQRKSQSFSRKVL